MLQYLGTVAELIWNAQKPVCLCVCCSGGKEREGDLQYYPFRMTPYLMKVQDAELAEEQFCCLLLAERVHSGYEGETCDHKRVVSHTFLVFTLHFTLSHWLI